MFVIHSNDVSRHLVKETLIHLPKLVYSGLYGNNASAFDCLCATAFGSFCFLFFASDAMQLV